MKNLVIITALVILTLNLNTCCREKEGPNCHYAITIVNSSDIDIYFLAGTDTIIIHNETPGGSLSDTYTVGAHQNKKLKSLHFWEYTICIEHLFTEELVVYGHKYGWLDFLRVNIYDANAGKQGLLSKAILRSYYLTLEDLQRLDWKITYPPTETMRDVKMYPPYGE